SLREGAVRLHESCPGNLAALIRHRVGNPESAFGTAEVVVGGRFGVQRHSGMPIETRGVLARHERRSGSLTVWSSTQWPHTLRRALCDALRLPESSVRVIAPDVGGGFGGKQDIY